MQQLGNRPLRVLVSMGGNAESKRCVLKSFLKVAKEVTQWKDSGATFHRQGMQARNALAPALVLTLGTNRVIPFFNLSERDWGYVANIELR